MYFYWKISSFGTGYVPAQANKSGQDFMGGGAGGPPLPHPGYGSEYIYFI